MACLRTLGWLRQSSTMFLLEESPCDAPVEKCTSTNASSRYHLSSWCDTGVAVEMSSKHGSLQRGLFLDWSFVSVINLAVGFLLSGWNLNHNSTATSAGPIRRLCHTYWKGCRRCTRLGTNNRAKSGLCNSITPPVVLYIKNILAPA